MDGNDVFSVYAGAKKAVEHIRSGQGPYFLEVPYFRARVHVGSETDEMKGFAFRSKEAVEAGLKLDPIVHATRKLIAEGVCTQADVDGWTAGCLRELDEVIAAAKASPYPGVDELLVGTY